ncbi:Predicted ATP-binding protein involved in virulence [Janthinobacterium lividum]|uniref:AAA family ATPase n=1 Tax=Janthinobacterium lividum TaxID=29581 RepID=UPI000E030A76|nr:AAA family ATPase [Janthinobacterium lividum]STR27829.1 Predicted ATP-binding protein involved in virulence [Janthinobacterium lividum]
MLDRISKAGGKFEKLTRPQIQVFLRYLELAIDFDLIIRLPSDLKLNFGELSTGEQNRTLLFAKILSVMQEGTTFLIDEPEISLHLHWQMSFHHTLMDLLSGLKCYHVIIATHAPIVISEAAKREPENKSNMVVVLRRKPTKGEALGENAPGAVLVGYEFHTFADVASHEQLVLRYFQTAPYHAREVSAELAEAVLDVAEDPSKTEEAIKSLKDLQSAVGLSPEATRHISLALKLIERGLVPSPVRNA